MYVINYKLRDVLEGVLTGEWEIKRIRQSSDYKRTEITAVLVDKKDYRYPEDYTYKKWRSTKYTELESNKILGYNLILNRHRVLL